MAAIPMAPLCEITQPQYNILIRVFLPGMAAIELLTQIRDEQSDCSQYKRCFLVDLVIFRIVIAVDELVDSVGSDLGMLRCLNGVRHDVCLKARMEKCTSRCR